jgi:mono/diheme cytochrome c family protein
MKNSNSVKLIGAIFVLAACLPVSADDFYADSDFADYIADVSNGKDLFQASACGACHGLIDGQDTLSGGLELSSKLGKFYSPNISSHMEFGIGGWTNGRFLNAVLKGRKEDGSKYFGSIFPYPAFAKMVPEDALDIKAYMATLPESDMENKPHKVSFPSKIIMGRWSEERPALEMAGSDQIQRGEYLVNVAGHCGECHTPRNTGTLTYKPDFERAFEGEVGLMGAYAPKITASYLDALGPETFVVGNMLEAKKLNGSPMTSPGKRRYAKSFSGLSLEDRTAIYAFLTEKNLDPETLRIADNAAKERIGKTTPNPIQPAVIRKDLTGATEMAQRVEAYCSAPVKTDIKPQQSGGVPKQILALADSVMDGYCRDCHGPGKPNVGSFPMGDIQSLGSDKRSVIPGDADASPLYASIANNFMPRGKSMSKDEVAAIAKWIHALGEVPSAEVKGIDLGKKTIGEFPKFIGGSIEETHIAALDDLKTIDQLDWTYTRYLNFSHTPLPPVDCDAEGPEKNPVYFLHTALNKFINSVSLGKRLIPVTPVPNTNGALVRIDLRDYNWSSEQWEAISRGAYNSSVSKADFSESAWSTLLNSTSNIYPYAIDPHSDPLLGALARSVGDNVPIIRADWFTRFASESPYYDVLLKLPNDIKILEDRMNVNVEENIFSKRVIRAGFAQGESGVSDHNRMLERHELANGGYYWKSYDFASSDGKGSLFTHPDGPGELGRTVSGTEAFEHDGGEMIFTLPNGLQGYYLSDHLGNRLLVGPTSIVSNRKKAHGRGIEIINARSCFECHDNGIIANTDVIRNGIQSSALFNNNQRDVLLRMYPETEVIQKAYIDDLKYFVANLSKLNATYTNSAGVEVSVRPPVITGQSELVTYLADLHFEDLEYDALAREFGLDVEQFTDLTFRIGDSRLSQIIATWRRRAENGLKIQRDEVENYWGILLPLITPLKPYIHGGGQPIMKAVSLDQYEKDYKAAVIETAEKLSQPYKPAATKPEQYEEFLKPSNPMQLLIRTDKTDKQVGEFLEFEISTNKDCELQIMYIEANKNIEEYPQQVLGPNILMAGEWRKIPFPGSKIRVQFDEPGNGETLVAFCRVGGLKEHRISKDGVLAFAKEHSVTKTRGVRFVAEEQVSQDKGESAFNFVTFNVR